MTPNETLIQAIHNHDGALVERLLGQGLDVNAQTDDGITPAVAAASFGFLDALHRLSRHGADLRAQNPNGDSPAHLAAAAGHPECLAFLLDHGVDANEVDGQGNPLIVLAALYDPHWRRRNAECLAVLTSRGADVNRRGARGFTAAMAACALGDQPSLELLARHGADLSLRDEGGADALDIARRHGSDECAGFIEAELCRREIEGAAAAPNPPAKPRGL